MAGIVIFEWQELLKKCVFNNNRGHHHTSNFNINEFIKNSSEIFEEFPKTYQSATKSITQYFDSFVPFKNSSILKPFNLR